MRSFSITVIAAAVVLSACATVDNARGRLVRAPATCTDQTVEVYFEPDSADLTREGRAVIDAAAAQARSCRVGAVEVLGLSDATGASQANLELSRKRAGAVSQALAAAGLPPAEFRVGAAGDAGAMTGDGRLAPLRRRVDVTLRLKPR